MHPEPIESALVVLAPEAEALVGAWRRRLDPSAEWGVPAHITLLYPFVPPGVIDELVRARIAVVLARVEPFRFSLAAARTFGDDVLYLSPEPADAFRRLTLLLAEAFPDYPPYGGAFAEIVPHLTVADGASAADMRAARSSVEGGLPIACRADAVALLAGAPAPDAWHVAGAWALGRKAGRPGGRR